jgi:molecular chaperone HtpG
MTTTTETVPFQAETRQLLDLVVHSLYTHREIFLRELISNASDALDRLRFEALTNTELLPGDEELWIRIDADSDAGTLRIVDNGVGMSRQEVIDHIGTIARSGSRGFLEALREKGDATAGSPELIGQFGVGFYSAFMVADSVVLVTRRAGEEQGTCWSSSGEGEYTLEEVDGVPRGTSITLHLKPREEDDEGWEDYADPHVLRRIVRRYSDFIEHPVRMLQVTTEEDAEPELETINSQKPLWTRPRSSVEDSEYAEFYKRLTHDWNDPAETIHFQAEGALEYTALLFLPQQRPHDLFDPNHLKPRVNLYVKRVFILADCEELLPQWLRFVRGVVDSSDLPLNVSRETLQHERQIGRIRERLVSKVLSALQRMKDQRPDDFRAFWRNFGTVLKEGLYHDEERRAELAKLAVWETSAGEEAVSLDTYVERKPVSQEAIYVLLADDRAAAERSPHLETFRAKGVEVLFLVDPVDEFVLQRLTEFEGVPLKPIDRGELELDDADDSDAKEREERETELAPLLEAVQSSLGEGVAGVRFSRRLAGSPAVLVAGENEIPAQLRRMLEESGQAVPPEKKTLELNADHALVKRLEALRDGGGEAFDEACELVHDLALIADGTPLPDPARFSELVTKVAGD